MKAEIHDFDAMDRALLGPDFADSQTPVMLRGVPLAAAGAANPVATDAAGGTSIAEMRRQQAAEDSTAQAEARQYCDQARAAEAAGKPGVAKIYYQMWRPGERAGALQDRDLLGACGGFLAPQTVGIHP